MSFQTYIVSLLVVYAFLQTSLGQHVKNEFQFEDVIKRQRITDKNTDWVWRSQAANLKTLRLEKSGRKSVVLKLCAEPMDSSRPIEAFISNVRYSNDGPPDLVTVWVNNVRIGSFRTIPYSNWGHHWNVFRNSQRVGRSFTLPRGEYRVRLRATTDRYGIELDQIEFMTLNQNRRQKFVCGASFGDD